MPIGSNLLHRKRLARYRGPAAGSACLIAGAVFLAWSSIPAPAQSQPEAPGQKTIACDGTDGAAAARVEACTRSLDQEVRDSARRRSAFLTYRALAHDANGDQMAAVADLTRAIRLDGEFAPAYEARADILRYAQSCDLALRDYDQAIKLAPQRAVTFISRALCLWGRSELERARADLDEAVRLDANNTAGVAATALALKGRIGLGANDADGALASYEQAIRLAPQRAELYLDRAAAWNLKGDFEKAFADYDHVIKLNADNSGGYALVANTLKAQLLASRGDLDAAIAQYNDAIKLAPQQPSLYLDRADLWTRKGDTERALADYGEAIKIDPANAAAYNIRGDFHRSKGDYTNALANYDQAIQKQPDDLTGYSNRGLVRYYQGEFAKAVDDFKRIVDTQANPYSTLMLYLSRARAGRKEARDELSKSADKLNKEQWPYPVVELFLGRKQAAAVEAAAKTPGEKCEAQFYVGEWQLTRNAKPAAQKALQSAADNCPKDFVEYRGAVEELKRLKP